MIISTSSARKILGAKYELLSDNEIEQMVNLIHRLCIMIIQQVVNKK